MKYEKKLANITKHLWHMQYIWITEIIRTAENIIANKTTEYIKHYS